MSTTTYILPLASNDRFFSESVVRNLTPNMVNNEYNKITSSSFVSEILSKIEPIVEASSESGVQALVSKAIYVAESISGEAISVSTVLGKKIGKANIGTTLLNDEDEPIFIHNDILGCALINYDGQITSEGIVIGKWIVGFGLLPGVVMLCDFKRESSNVVGQSNVSKDNQKFQRLHEIIRDWFKDRDWKCSSINDNVILFLQDVLTDE